MKSKQIKQITDGAVVVAIYGLIFLISKFTGGQLEYSISFLMPIPIAIYAFKYNLKLSLVPFLASIVVSFLLSINPLNVLVFNIPYLIIGSILGGVLVKVNIKPIYSILIITFILSISEVLGSVILANLLGYENIFIDIQNTVGYLEHLLGVNNWDFGLIQALLEGIIPSIIIVISLMSALVTYLMFIILCKRIFKYQFNRNVLSIFSVENLIPKWFSIVYVLIYLGAIISLIFFSQSSGGIKILFVVLINASLIIGAGYLYFGIRVSSLFIRYINKKWLLFVEFVLVIFASPIFVILGILDNFLGLQVKLVNKIASKN